MRHPQESVIVALDCSIDEAYDFAELLSGKAEWVKIGMTLFYRGGPELVTFFKERGFKVFLDLKIHDIPFQVEGAVFSAALTGADMLSIHASGSSEMIAAARRGAVRAAEVLGVPRCKLVAISVLTSMDKSALEEIGVPHEVPNQVERLTRLALEAGADGMVCSPQEVAVLSSEINSEALYVCPGVRPQGADLQDQKRVATPLDAIRSGATHLVIGRPITGAHNPVEALEAIYEEMRSIG